MSSKSTTGLDQKLFADLQLTDEVIGNDYAADGVTVVSTCRIPLEDLLRKGIVPLDAPLATVNSANTVSVAGPRFGQTSDDKLVIKWSQTAGVNGWSTPFATTGQGALADSALQPADIVDTLTSLESDKVLSAAQGKALKDLIDAINTVLTSDDVSLDELQELVDYIKLNRSDLDVLGIANIAGLQAALDAKQATLVEVSQAQAEGGTDTTIRGWTAERVKQAIDAIGAANLAAAEQAAEDSEAWANTDEDVLVPAANGGNEVDEYSAKNHAAKASDSASAAAGSAAVAASISGSVANPKAFAGGVVTSDTGNISLRDSGYYSFTAGTSICIKWSRLSYTGNGRGLLSWSRGKPAYNILSYYSIVDSFWLRDNSGTIATGGNSLTSAELSEQASYVFSWSADGNDCFIYRNGVLIDTLDASGLGEVRINRMGKGYSTPEYVSGIHGDFAFFNRDLDSYDAADIYLNGIQSWLAANPENKWALQTVSNGVFSNSGFSTVTSADANGFDVTASGDSSPDIVSTGWTPPPYESGVLRLTFDITTNTTGAGITLQGYNTSGGLAYVSHFATSGTGTMTVDVPVSAYSDDIRFRFRFSGTTTGDVVLENLVGEYIGCLACLPMDEGVGYQLHDLSTNKHDALLSETGFEHLISKREGFIRSFGTDAYNGGSGDVELLSSSRAILPAGAIITDAQIRNNAAGTIGAGLLDLKRSDRTNRNTIGDNAIDAQTTELGTLSTDGAAQISDDLNVALDGSGDSDATDVDVRVDYKLID